MNPTTPRRTVRSFVLRTGRITPGQRRALVELWPQYGLAADQAFAQQTVFGGIAPLTVEIGFGNGDALLSLAKQQPERHFIGIEVHSPGIGRLLLALKSEGLNNVRIIQGDAVAVLGHCFAPASLSAVNIWFPDPWPKKRHWKRRLVQAEFIHLVTQRLRPGGRLHMATDWRDYAGHMLAIGDADPGLRNDSGRGAYCRVDTGRPASRFQQRGQRLGHGEWDLVYTKT